MKKRIFSLILAVIMLISVLPVSALAAETASEEPKVESSESEVRSSKAEGAKSPYEGWTAEQLYEKFKELESAGDQAALHAFLDALSDAQAEALDKIIEAAEAASREREREQEGESSLESAEEGEEFEVRSSVEVVPENDVAEDPETAAESCESEDEEIKEKSEESLEPEEEDDEPAEELQDFALSEQAGNVIVTLEAEAGAFGELKAEEAMLSVKKIEDYEAVAGEIEEAVSENREEDANLVSSYKFDISVFNKDGNEVQPVDGAVVRVSFALAEVVDREQNLTLSVYHVKEEESALKAEELAAEEAIAAEETVVTVETDGFSYYVVEFTYNNLEYVLEGDESVALSVILDAVGLSGIASDAEGSNDALFIVEKDAAGDDWTVTALEAFNSEEWLKVTIDGVEYTIKVTDDAAGSRQKITIEDIEGGAFYAYHAVEGGVELTLYCFNSELAWPVTGDRYKNEYFVPDENLELSDEVMDKIYRIFYAGYPHNNLGLFAPESNPVTDEELANACIPPDVAKDYLEYYDWTNLSFTPENLVNTFSAEYEVINDIILWTILDSSFSAAIANAKPEFMSLTNALYWEPTTVAQLKQYYENEKNTASPGKFHDATQIAIWRILYENNVPNNSKSMEAELADPLTRSLVDFANGVGLYANAYIPDRGTTIEEMNTYKIGFESGAQLLRADNSPVGAGGTVVFTQKSDGLYTSEPLHFADGTYALPYTIRLDDGTSIVNNGSGEFELRASAPTAGGTVTVETENMFPSDIYQYVIEAQKDIPVSQLSHNAGHVQDMSGVYFESLPLEFTMKATFVAAPGDLTVQKIVAGNAGDETKEFNFTVTLNDDSINGQYGEMTFEDGVATFTLKHKDVKKATGLPNGIGYTVTEAGADGYDTTMTGETGTIASFETAEAVFTNTRNTYGNLKVSKTLEGNATDKDRYFEFTVTLDDTNINGTYGDLTFTNGEATFKLKGGEEITAEDLPNGVGYTVQEDDYSQDGYLTEAIGDKSTIVGDSTLEAKFFNLRNAEGSLTIGKILEGNDTDSSKEFTFTITLTPASGQTPINGLYSGVEFKNGEATIQLKGGEYKTITDLPHGIGYTVTETDYTDDGYSARTTQSGNTGTISEHAVSNVEYINTRNTYGNLTVTKTVEGNAGSQAKEFKFIVRLSDKTINDTFGDMTFVNGDCEITLKHGESLTATGLPNGVDYTVEEHDYSADGYVTTKTGETGTITGGSTLTAAFVNTRNAFGSLTVSKTLQGNDTDSTKEFSFKIKLGNTDINGTYNGVEFKNGVATILLKGGESKTIEGLPNGTSYTVTEENYSADGYTTTSKGTTGHIQENKAAVAEFFNTRNTYGGLKVSKTLEGNATDSNKEFRFTVTLSDPNINGQYGQMNFVNGVATFMLKGGESITATDLPNGIEYSVSEQDYSDDGYLTKATGEKSVIAGGSTLEASFVNLRNAVGTLTIGKALEGNDTDSTKPFTFTITLDPAESGTYSGVEFVDGVATIELRGGEYKTITGLPNKIGYTVTEADYKADGYTARTTQSGNTGTINENAPANVEYINTRNTYGGLKVTKTLEGNATDPDKEFSFTVRLKDESINGQYGGMTFANGVATFKLKGGESKTAINLPNGIDYTVLEEDNSEEGYLVKASGDTGAIAGGSTLEAHFINLRNAEGSLTIGKALEGNDTDPTKAFEFTITLTPAVSGTYSGVVFSNGVATIELRGGEYKTIDGLPNGTKYTVTETDYTGDGYSARTTASGHTGTISEHAVSNVEYINTRNTYGRLTIKKTLEGNNPEAEREFNFTVTLSDTSITGEHGEMIFTNGVATVKLKGGEYKIADRLPNGVGYTVQEDDYSQDGYLTKPVFASGVIDGGSTLEAEFFNLRNSYGNLTIGKLLEGNDVDAQKDFEFTIKLDDTTITGRFVNPDDTNDYVDFENGVAHITLKGGEYKTVYGLPHGTNYTVIETDYASEGYQTRTSPSGHSGKIEADTWANVEYINTRNSYGDLTVTKTVEGNAGDSGKAFEFIVTLSDTSINGTYGGMTFTNGVASFSLKHGESKTAEDLPNGVGYTVTEDNYSGVGYVTTKTGDTGTIDGDAVMTAAFINTRNAEGSLTVSKTLEGNDTDPTKEFEFTITLTPALNGTYSDVVFINGVATVKLKGGESKTIEGLPNRTQYTVAEKDYRADGYVTTKTGETGTISETEAAVAAFINTRDTFGKLVVTKTVTGITGDKTKAFNFKVTLKDSSINGEYGEMTFVNGVAAFTLKHGESKTAEDLPNGVEYTVTEDDYSSQGYTTEKSGDTGAIKGDETKTAAFINDSQLLGNLRIQKTVSGDLGDRRRLFTFTVTFSDSGTYNYSGSYSGIIRSGGSVLLRHGEHIVIEDLPAGIGYTVTESGNTGYTVTKRGDTGTIPVDGTAIADFNNYRGHTPKTGDDHDPRAWALMMLGAMAGICGVAAVGRKKRKATND